MTAKDKNILLIGNGFDLALGFKTQYEDFMKLVLSANERSLDDFKKYIVEEWKLNKCDAKLVSSFYDKVKAICGKNLIMDYFINYYAETMSWADVETELMHIGQCLESVVSALQKEEVSFYGDASAEIVFEDDLKYYSDYLSFFQNNELFTLDVDGTFDSRGRTYTYFSIEDESIKNSCKTNRARMLKFIKILPDLFYQKLLDFSELFEEYLRIEANRPISLFKIKHGITYVITYNYTHNYKMIGCPAFHVNGEILPDGKTNGIIFGIDPSAAFRTTSFRNITKEIQRSAHNIKVSAISNICEEVDNVYIFGYSLTIADKESIKLVFESAKSSSFMTKIIIFYKSGSNAKEDLKAKTELSNNLKKILEDDYSNIANLITFKRSEEFFE